MVPDTCSYLDTEFLARTAICQRAPARTSTAISDSVAAWRISWGTMLCHSPDIRRGSTRLSPWDHRLRIGLCRFQLAERFSQSASRLEAISRLSGSTAIYRHSVRLASELSHSITTQQREGIVALLSS